MRTNRSSIKPAASLLALSVATAVLKAIRICLMKSISSSVFKSAALLSGRSPASVRIPSDSLHAAKVFEFTAPSSSGEYCIGFHLTAVHYFAQNLDAHLNVSRWHL